MPIVKEVPSYDAYLLPVVQRLRVHGGSMTIQEMVDDVATAMGLSEEQRAIEHGKTGRSEVDYRLAWARTYLKKVGALENSTRGVWRLTPAGGAMSDAEIASIRRQVHQGYAAQRARQIAQPSPEPANGPDTVEAEDWQSRLLERLRTIEPSAFERLCQRLLRESDFVKVEVTGRSGDGGIDGTGVLRVALLSFHVLFQCKRYSGSVGAGAVRDFRGAMVGRTDKGLIITTGTFTADARREATRDGAPAIDLVDGEALCELLKAKGLGVNVRMVEAVDLDEAALASF